jgi:hypothetical protein
MSRNKRLLTWSKSLSLLRSGERPPWTQKNRLSTTAATGRAQNECMHASYTREEYLCRPVNGKQPVAKMSQGRTFPLESKIFSEMPAFVISAEQDKLGWVAQFEGI